MTMQSLQHLRNKIFPDNSLQYISALDRSVYLLWANSRHFGGERILRKLNRCSQLRAIATAMGPVALVTAEEQYTTSPLLGTYNVLEKLLEK